MSNKKKITKSMRIDKDILDKLRQLATANNRSISNYIETVLKNYLEIKG